MANISDIMENMLRDGPRSGGKRRSIPANEIGSRLEIYKENGDFEITTEHETALQAIFTDLANVLITGGAGTGKTSLIQNLVIPELDHRGLNYAVTATTGIAGSHLNGKTIHSWAGIGLGPHFPANGIPPQDRAPSDLAGFYERHYEEWSTTMKGGGSAMRDGVRKRIKGTEVLILDEISMCAGAGLLGYLDFFFRKVREKPELPFGGIQMIFCGDFCQLPPVEKGDPRVPDWAFLSAAWAGAKVRPIELTKIFRQADVTFANFLNRIRKGKPVDPEYVRSFVRDMTPEEALCASYLVPTNAKCDRLNNQVLDMYPGPTVNVDCRFDIEPSLLAHYETVDKVQGQLSNAMRGKVRLPLRIGIPVLFTINSPGGEFVNGTKGFVDGIFDDKMMPVKEVADITQIQVRIPPRDKDGEDRTVLLGRHRTMRNQMEDPEEMTTAYDGPNAGQTVRRWPSVTQFPLIPATAVTIHRSQGMSMDECVVDLRQSFASGHVYVAMSRLRTAAGLTLTSDEFEVLVDEHVMAYYRSISPPPVAPMM